MTTSLTQELDEQIEALRFELREWQHRLSNPSFSEARRMEAAERCRRAKAEVNRLVNSRAALRRNIRACGGSPYA